MAFSPLSLNPTVLPTSTASFSVQNTGRIQEQLYLVNDDTDTLLEIDATQLHNGRRTITHTRDSVVTRRGNLVYLIALDDSHLDPDLSKQD